MVREKEREYGCNRWIKERRLKEVATTSHVRKQLPVIVDSHNVVSKEAATYVDAVCRTFSPEELPPVEHHLAGQLWYSQSWGAARGEKIREKRERERKEGEV